jgi:hypothetical protein
LIKRPSFMDALAHLTVVSWLLFGDVLRTTKTQHMKFHSRIRGVKHCKAKYVSTVQRYRMREKLVIEHTLSMYMHPSDESSSIPWKYNLSLDWMILDLKLLDIYAFKSPIHSLLAKPSAAVRMSRANLLALKSACLRLCLLCP